MKQRRVCGVLMSVFIVLVAVGGVWMRTQRQQYALNRALIAALVHDDTKTALALVNAGADPNTRFAPSPAPTFKLVFDQILHHSESSADWSPTAFMMACGEYQNLMDLEVLFAADSHDSYELVQAMLAHNSDMRAQILRGDNALFSAVQSGRLRITELLLQHGADVNAQGFSGVTPLMEASLRANPDMTRLLLAHSADVNVRDDAGNTCLHHAAGCNVALETIKMLLAYGADANVLNHDKATALMIANRQHYADKVALLRLSGKQQTMSNNAPHATPRGKP